MWWICCIRIRRLCLSRARCFWARYSVRYENTSIFLKIIVATVVEARTEIGSILRHPVSRSTIILLIFHVLILTPSTCHERYPWQLLIPSTKVAYFYKHRMRFFRSDTASPQLEHLTLPRPISPPDAAVDLFTWWFPVNENSRANINRASNPARWKKEKKPTNSTSLGRRCRSDYYKYTSEDLKLDPFLLSFCWVTAVIDMVPSKIQSITALSHFDVSTQNIADQWSKQVLALFPSQNPGASNDSIVDLQRTSPFGVVLLLQLTFTKEEKCMSYSHNFQRLKL